MAWINPKIKWTGNNDERFNVDPDYLRIKGNIEYLADLCTKYYRNPNIIPLQTADLTTIPYVSFFNNITADVDLIADVIGRTEDNEDMRVIYENQPIWNYNDLNIIESNTLWEYNKIVPQYQVSRKVPFEQCGLGGMF